MKTLLKKFLFNALFISIVNSSLSIQALTESELVKTRFTYFNDHISKLSVGDISKALEETIIAAHKNKLNVSLVLNQLKTKVQERVSFYQQEVDQHNSIKATLIKLALGSVITAIGATCLIYNLNRSSSRKQLRNQKLQQKYDALAKELKKRGITIKEEFFFHTTIVHVKRPFIISPEDEQYLKVTSDEMLSLHHQIHSDLEESPSFIGPTGACMFFAGITGIYITLFPDKDKEYEKKKQNNEIMLKNFTLLFEQIDLMLSKLTMAN